jgi:hypothetical protein
VNLYGIYLQYRKCDVAARRYEACAQSEGRSRAVGRCDQYRNATVL